MLTRLVSILAVLGLSACSVDTIDDSDVNQEKLYGDYRVTFDNGDKEVRHYVQFRVAGSTGTTVRLSEGAIEYDGNEMSIFDGDEAFINIGGTFYHQTYSADMPNPTYTYKWTRGDGSAFDNVATMPAAFTVTSPAADTVVPSSGGLTIVLAGDALANGEEYIATIESKVPMSQRSISKTVGSGNEIIVSPEEWAEMPEGEALIRISRVRVAPIQAGHDDAGGRIETVYRAASIPIQIMALQPVG